MNISNLNFLSKFKKNVFFSTERFEAVQKLISDGDGITQGMLNVGVIDAARLGKHKSVTFFSQIYDPRDIYTLFF